MSKAPLLHYLRSAKSADAFEIAAHFGIQYSAAAMALLRLVRQNLAQRLCDPETGVFWYRLTNQGKERLDWFISNNIE